MSKNNSFLNRLFMVLVFVFLYAPIFLLIIFSFNAGKSNVVWQGFSLEWYGKLLNNRLIMQSVYTTLLVSLLATVIATIAGTFAAIGFFSMRRKVREPLMTFQKACIQVQPRSMAASTRFLSICRSLGPTDRIT